MDKNCFKKENSASEIKMFAEGGDKGDSNEISEAGKADAPSAGNEFDAG